MLSRRGGSRWQDGTSRSATSRSSIRDGRGMGQLLALIALLGLTAPAAWPVHGERVRGHSIAPRPRLRPVRAADLPGLSRRPRCGATVESLHDLAARLQPGRRADPVLHPADPGELAVQPDRRGRCHPGAVVQHRGQLYHEHGLAELRPRDHGEPSHPDGRTHHPELHVRGGGSCRDGRADPGFARRSAHRRELLGRRRPHDAPDPASPQPPLCGGVPRLGRDPEHARLHRGAYGGRRDAEDPRRTARQPRGDQDGRHQWRRVLQHQLGAPVREPHEAHRVPPALRHPAGAVRGPRSPSVAW